MLSLEAERIQGKTIKILATAQVLSGIGIAGTVAAGSLLVTSITNSETLAGLTQTSAVLGAAAMAIPLSRLTQKGGRRLGLSVGYISGAMGALLAILGGVRENLLFMLMGAFMLGAASAAGYQARFAATDLATNQTRSRHLSFVVWGSTFGAVTGPNLMGPSGNIAELMGLPRLVGPYLIALVTLTLGTIVIQVFLRPDPYLTAIHLKNDGKVRKKLLPARAALKVIRQSPRALIGIVAIAIGHLAMVSVMVMTPVHMAHVDVTITVIGLVISIHVAGMYAFSPIVGWLSDKYGHISVIRTGVTILIFATIVAGTAAADDAISLGIGLFMLGLGWSCTLISGSALLSESVDRDIAPSAQGASDLLMNLAGAGGGALAGVIIGTLGYGWLCVFAALPVTFLGVWSFSKKL
jgi:MFS family permease